MNGTNDLSANVVEHFLDELPIMLDMAATRPWTE